MEAQNIISSGLLELYALGASSPEESREVEGWVKQYPEVATELAYIHESMEAYAQTHAIAPDVSVKEKLFIKINASAAVPVISIKEKTIDAAMVYSISPIWKYAAAASIILLIGSVIFNYTYYNKYNTVNDELQTAQTELQQTKELAAAMKGDMDMIGSKNAMPVSLKGMPTVPDAAARIYWMQDTHEVYVDPSNLPEAPAGMQYQFWGIVDGVPVSGGMISTLKDGRKVHLQKMKTFGKAEAFAVSLEKAGPEKPKPSEVVVMGKI